LKNTEIGRIKEYDRIACGKQRSENHKKLWVAIIWMDTKFIGTENLRSPNIIWIYLFVNVIRKNYRDNFKEATYKWATKESPPLERRIEKHRNNKNRGILEQRIEKHRNSKNRGIL
jgi:hypothetical protein